MGSYTAGPTYPKTCVSDATAGSVVWTSPGNITTNGASFASAAVTACFVHGTMIATTDGDKEIETLQIGDEVLAFKGKIVSVVKITGIHDDYASTLVNLWYPQELRVTPEHPIASGENWVNANDLKIGDAITRVENGRVITGYVAHTELEVLDEAVPVRTLTVTAPHTFVANGLGVHNK